MTIQLGVFGTLGILTTVWAVVANRRLFAGGTVAGPRPSRSSTTPWASSRSASAGTATCATPTTRPTPSYWNYTKALFTNWAAAVGRQDYTIVNLVLLPLWTIVDGRRRGLAIPWIFFVMSLFTSLAFSMALYLAFVERQVRYDASIGDGGAPGPVASAAPVRTTG